MITGWSVDFLIVATVTAIQVLVVWTYMVPFLTMYCSWGKGSHPITWKEQWQFTGP